jgi:hypothetical protein
MRLNQAWGGEWVDRFGEWEFWVDYVPLFHSSRCLYANARSLRVADYTSR